MSWPVRELFRRAFLDNAALKLVALLLSLTLFIVVRGDRETSISFSLPVAYTETEGRVMTGRPVDSVRITVAGPWTRVRKFDESKVEPLHVDLSKQTDGDYMFAESLIELPPGLRVTSISPPSVRLQFEERASKVVRVKPKFQGLPARGYSLGEVTVTPSHVTVRGPKSIVNAMSEVNTRPIVVDGLTSGGEERVGLEPTEPNVSVMEGQTIDVRFRIVEELGLMALGPLAVAVHPAPGLSVPTGTTTDPARVKLVLRGAKNILDRIDPKEVATYVTWHAEDARGNEPRPARVVVEGVPPGVAIEVDPRDVKLVPKR